MISSTLQLNAQRIKVIEPSTDPSAPADIFNEIMGDTTETGERVDNNTIYKLQNGQIYITSGRLVNTTDWKLHIEAVDLEDTAVKPILSRIPNASGTYPDIMWPKGDLTLKNLWIISGEKGPLETMDWGKIRISGENTRVIVDNCLIEKDRGGFLQMRADGIKCYVTNCLFRNGSNRRILEGNGRGIDTRNYAMDTLIIKNTIVHNIADRFLRSQGGTVPHNYIEIDHCTGFNITGRHGFIQLGRVNTAKITNNLFINPLMQGTSPKYTDEQTQPDNDAHKVITLDTLFENTALEISNNNIFWTQDVIDYWATNDSVSMPAVLSDLVIESLGDKVENAYFQDPLELNNVPGSVLQFVIDLYADPTSLNMYDLTVEDIALAGSDYDSGNLFDFASFDPCYSPDASSAHADTEGDAIGAVANCAELASGVQETRINNALELFVYPNPAQNVTSFSFTTAMKGRVNLKIFDIQGNLITTLLNQETYPGNHTAIWDNLESFAAGIYFAYISTPEGRMYTKVILE